MKTIYYEQLQGTTNTGVKCSDAILLCHFLSFYWATTRKARKIFSTVTNNIMSTSLIKIKEKNFNFYCHN